MHSANKRFVKHLGVLQYSGRLMSYKNYREIDRTQTYLGPMLSSVRRLDLVPRGREGKWRLPCGGMPRSMGRASMHHGAAATPLIGPHNAKRGWVTGRWTWEVEFSLQSTTSL